ncbi:MAG: penicillin-binding transpeptidase domain-containing protein, partial [Mycobacteriales bacterium]
MIGRRSSARLVVVEVLVISLFATLFARLWYVQVVSGEQYQAAAQSNVTRTLTIPPPRGLVVDDTGQPLVGNHASWVVEVDHSTFDKLSTARQHAVLTRLAAVVHSTAKELAARASLCGASGAAKPPTCWNGSPYAAVPVAGVTTAQAASVLELAEDYPGVTVTTENVRAYPAPDGTNAAQVLGYLGPITQQELSQERKAGQTELTPTSRVGRAGLEQVYDRVLRGTPGVQRVTVDSAGRVVKQSVVRQPEPGDTLVTSIDAKVQAVAEQQLAAGIARRRQQIDTVTNTFYRADSGAAVVLDPRTGRVIAMASYPTYQPSVWSGGISQHNLDRLERPNSDQPLLNRAIQGLYAPGSTFKPFNAVGALDNGFGFTSQLDCTSSFSVGGQVFRNFESESLGMIG